MPKTREVKWYKSLLGRRRKDEFFLDVLKRDSYRSNQTIVKETIKNMIRRYKDKH